MHHLPRPIVAALGLAAVIFITPSRAQAQTDPCAGGLDSKRIVDCLSPGGRAPTTRGIRPSGPAAPQPGPGGAQPAAAPPSSSVDLTVPFGFDSAELTAQGRAALDALGVALKDPALASAKFRIAGHTDAKGSDSYNLALSERRANTALHYLADHASIDPGRLSAIGFGRTQLYDPANPNAASNRRVQVIRVEN